MIRSIGTVLKVAGIKNSSSGYAHWNWSVLPAFLLWSPISQMKRLRLRSLLAYWVSSSRLFPASLASVLLGGGTTLLLITQGVLQLDPWYQPSYMIPLAGMIFAASMTNISLALERLHAELQNGVAFPLARETAFRTSMIPVINSFLAVGLISLPGMMTGQILSGVSPLVAVRYQIMVMCMIFGAAGLSTVCFLIVIRKTRHFKTGF